MEHTYVDFHCHLDLYPNFQAAVEEAERSGVYTLTVTTTPKAWARNHEVTSHTRYIRAALGLHPQLVHERAGELGLWEECLPHTRYVGEVGLDAGPKHYRSLEAQKEVFQHVLKCCARAGGKVLSVHSIRSAKIVLDLVEQHLHPEQGRVVLHWFTGSKSEARRAVELGCYFSINSQMLMNERGRSLVETLPKERLLTETDGPFTQIGTRSTVPSDVSVAVNQIAQLHNIEVSTAALMIRDNLKLLLQLTMETD